MILVGNKSDLSASREVSQDEAEGFASQHGLIYVETSAKTSDNVDLCFTTLAEQVLERIESGQINPTDEVRVQSESQVNFFRSESRSERQPSQEMVEPNSAAEEMEMVPENQIVANSHQD